MIGCVLGVWLAGVVITAFGRMTFSPSDEEAADAAMHAVRMGVAWPIFAGVLVLTSPLYAWRLLAPARKPHECVECVKRGPYR